MILVNSVYDPWTRDIYLLIFETIARNEFKEKKKKDKRILLSSPDWP